MNFNSSFHFTHKSLGHFNPRKWGCNTEQEYTFLEQYKIPRKGIVFTELPQIRKTTPPLLPFFLDTSPSKSMRMKLQYNTWTQISATLSVWEILRLRQHRLWNKLANIPVGERGIESWLFLAQDCMQSPHIVSELLPPKESFYVKQAPWLLPNSCESPAALLWILSHFSPLCSVNDLGTNLCWPGQGCSHLPVEQELHHTHLRVKKAPWTPLKATRVDICWGL